MEANIKNNTANDNNKVEEEIKKDEPTQKKVYMDVNEYNNEDEDKQEILSEENDFVVDLGNASPLKDTKSLENTSNEELYCIDKSLNNNLKSIHDVSNNNSNNNLISQSFGPFDGSINENLKEDELKSKNSLNEKISIQNNNNANEQNIHNIEPNSIKRFSLEEIGYDSDNDFRIIKDKEITEKDKNENLSSENNLRNSIEKEFLFNKNPIQSNENNQIVSSSIINIFTIEDGSKGKEIENNDKILDNNLINNGKIPIQDKLASDNENVNFYTNKNPLNKNTNNLKNEINEKVEFNEDEFIKSNSTITNSKANRILMSDLDQKLKFEKLLNTNLDAKMQFRICIVGESNVGKTSILTRYCDETFKSSLTNTIGVDFRVLMLKYNDMNIKLQIWDTAGQERFKSICVNYFKSANGFIFIYDITNRKSFENLNSWFDLVEQHNKNSICNFVVGNKCDLENMRQVSIEEGRDLAFSKKFNFMETSAKSSKNVDMAFEIFTLKLIEFCTIDANLNSDDNSSNYSSLDENGKKFKIEDVYDENTMSKKKKKNSCKC